MKFFFLETLKVSETVKLLVVLFVEVWRSGILEGMGTLKVLSESSSRKWILPGREKQQPNSQGEKKTAGTWVGRPGCYRQIHALLASVSGHRNVRPLGPRCPVVYRWSLDCTHLQARKQPLLFRDKAKTEGFRQAVSHPHTSANHITINVPPPKPQRVATMFPQQAWAHQWSKKLVDSEQNLETK